MAKPYSDLDLAIAGERKLEARVLRQLQEDFAESDIPFRVEILDWHRLAGKFKKIIEQRYEVI
jgi:predicted nucleotidyltransferase